MTTAPFDFDTVIDRRNTASEKWDKYRGRMTPVEATYLAWIDATGIPAPARFFEEAGVGLSDGADFGAPGFVRLNFGCSCSLLAEALGRMRRALEEFRGNDGRCGIMRERS